MKGEIKEVIKWIQILYDTEHRRKQAKGRVRFSMVINKVLIGSVVLATPANPLNTVYAANTQQPNVPTANYTVEIRYEQSIENIKFKSTTPSITWKRKLENKVSKSLIKNGKWVDRAGINNKLSGAK